MASNSAGRSAQATPVRRWDVRRWPMWEMAPGLATSVLLVEITAVALVSASVVNGPPPVGIALVHAGILLGLGVLHTEAVVGVERMRRRVATPHHVDLSSVWIFAAAVVLPSAVAALVATALLTYIWCRTGRPRVPLYRQNFTTATMVLACVAASSVVARTGGGGLPALGGADLLSLGLALLLFTTVNSALIAGAIAMSTPQPAAATIFGHWDDNVLEMATLCLGALVAVALMVNPWLVVLALPPLLVLHRSVLVRHLEEVAITDTKTGLLNSGAWHAQAESALRRAGRPGRSRAVLVLDLDHFKAVNDTYGHLAGDQVLAAVASAVASEVRDEDLVGRFGGEEFVILLVGKDGGADEEFTAVAERIRRRVAALRVEISTPDGPLTVAGLSVSVGGVVCPAEGGDLLGLLQFADTALYAAKRAGRNVVRFGAARRVTSPRAVGEATAGLG